jgi:hypothetical protein
MDVLRVGHEPHADIFALVHRYALVLRHFAAGQSLPGSYWGEGEAGLRGNELFTRPDTPLHSLLHELCHYVCMTAERRLGLDRDAGGDDAEESAVCYLQILLADELPALGRERMLLDMDAWGYSFRLGSARAWFELDAADASAWLRVHGLVDGAGRPTFALRGPGSKNSPHSRV